MRNELSGIIQEDIFLTVALETLGISSRLSSLLTFYPHMIREISSLLLV